MATFEVSGLAPGLDQHMVEHCAGDVLVDRIVPGEILVISFGFVSWDTRPAFDFYGRLKKLESLTGRHLNKILVRDSGNAWYHRAIAGLGQHADDSAAALAELVRQVAPSRVVTIGQSMGAYAAIMFGLLLDARQVIAFGPLSFLDVAQAGLDHERRWMAVMQDLARDPPPSGYPDLAVLLRERAHQHTALDIVFGTHPGAGAGSEAVNLDAMHAHRLAAAGRCTLWPYADSGHAVVQHLIDARQIDALLARLLLGVTIEPVREPELELKLELELDHGWRGWVAENVRLGADPAELLAILRQHGFSAAASQAALAQARLALE